MRIGINLISLEPTKIGGMEQYIRNLLHYSNSKFVGYDFYLYLNSRNEHTFSDEYGTKIVISENPIEKDLQIYRSIKELSIDLWFCPLLNLEPKFLDIPSVVTIPDLQHEFFPEFFSKEIISWRNKNFKFSVEHADAVLTLSEFSKDTIIQTYGVSHNKVHSIYLDASKEFHTPLDRERILTVKEQYKLPERFGFYPANTWPHKNHLSLLKAIKILKDTYQTKINLVFTGSEHQASSEVKKYISQNNISDQIQFLGYINQDDMRYVFKNASFLVFPSLFEGFGIPLVEAMCSETPIICSKEGSIPEVVGECALLFDALDPKDIANKIMEVQDTQTQKDLVGKGRLQAQMFSWENSAKGTLEVFNSVNLSHHNKSRDIYPLVTIVTPSYNQGRFIRETIDSILTQDYPNIEYIVMDGGSTDETVEILKSYGDRIKWISEKDGGQADAVNKGIQLASGEIIGWLNSDDTYLPGAIKQAVNFLTSHQDIGVVYGEGYHTKENGEIIDRYPTESFNFKRLAQTCFICQPTAFFRKEVFRTVGLLKKELHLCMDYELWMRIAKTYEIAYIPYFFATSRMYEDNKTLSRRKEVFAEIIKTVKFHYGYVPLSWVNGYVDYKLGPKRSLYFFIILFLHFLNENYRNPSYCVREIYDVLKARLKYHLQDAPTTISKFEDGWVSKRYETTLQSNSGGNRKSVLRIMGRHLAPYSKPLVISLFIESRFISKHEIVEKGVFTIEVPVELNHTNLSIALTANKTFVPRKLKINSDNRELAYIIDKIEIVQEELLQV
jgi:glycosyltransferase involved in cell wall biosynthesis